MEENVLLKCTGISKSFGGTRALKSVGLEIRRGEVHALLGENGAGKSTLMKIIMGLHSRDSGEIWFDGEDYNPKSPADALSTGISMIHQELNSEPYLTVAETIYLHREDFYGKTPFLDKKKTNLRAQVLLDKFGLDFPPTAEINTLSLAQTQMVEIAKAVSFDAKLIIMDEPTASLDYQETMKLFNTIRELKAQGVSIIYISHRMEETFSICDRLTVFRDGEHISTMDVENVTRENLINLMVGRKVENIFPRTDNQLGDVALEVKDLSGDGFNNINFKLRYGEILGISGLVGSGRSETLRAIFGIDKVTHGQILIDGKEVKIKHPKEAVDFGIAMVNEDRKGYGLCLNRSILENISLPSLFQRQVSFLINGKKEMKDANEAANRLSVKRASLLYDALSLSGGNQQKVVLAKWLLTSPRVLLLDEPTRGVDVGAKSEIHEIMNNLAKSGLAIIMVSSELQEIMGMSDRILTYCEGEISGEFFRKDILSGEVSQEDILAKEFAQ